MADRLVQELSCLTTCDKEALIAQFHTIISPQTVADRTAIFYLDMNSWNLQEALTSFYDYQFEPAFPEELTSGMYYGSQLLRIESETPPSTNGNICSGRVMYIDYYVRNTGTMAWEDGTTVITHSGHCLSYDATVDNLEPGQYGYVKIRFNVPQLPGEFSTKLSLSAPHCPAFGDLFVLEYNVFVPGSASTDDAVSIIFGETSRPIISAEDDQMINTILQEEMAAIASSSTATGGAGAGPSTSPAHHGNDDEYMS